MGGLAMRALVSSIAFAIALLAATSAHASPLRDWVNGIERHEGLMLRLNAGAGFGAVSGPGLEGADLTGAVLTVGGAIGYSVNDYVAISAEGFGWLMQNAEADVFFESSIVGSAHASVLAFGPGITLFVPVVDIELATMIGVSLPDIDSPQVTDVFGTHETTTTGEPGFAARFALTKSFWVAGELGLGLGLELFVATAPATEGIAPAISGALCGSIVYD